MNKMKKEHLSIDIYTDKYPKPKLVGGRLPEVIVVDDTITIPYVVNSPTHVNSEEIVRDRKSYYDEVTIYNNKKICATILCTLSCIGIGVACILISLEQNQPSDKSIIHLEGQILYVFYLGAFILGCVGFCVCTFSCVRCCSELCPVFCT